MVSVQRRPALGGQRERHDEYRVSRPEHSDDRCKHRLLSVVSIVSIRVEGGYVGRCLLCGSTGPVRARGEAARGALSEQIGSDEGRRIAFQ